MMHSTWIDSPLGQLMLAGDENGLCGLWMKDQKYFGASLPEGAEERELPVFAAAKDWLARYFDGQNPCIDFPLTPEGSEFRQSVWKQLLSIPYGSTTSYGQIAKKLEALCGRAVSAQAVGGAVGHNPISIIIPCHRVLGSNGNLTGYAGGIERKIWLLRHEGADPALLRIPTRGTAL
ncbi:methylated-DNA--[protein]-cysteine S-methyltransferase [Eubacteriales bacterium OttesenSCG-928-N13]|nr:methylated-DNA--[protein]-cysteine S-methyltransferase [Eubacteriales bacterium OttesenSCG-928-N13]